MLLKAVGSGSEGNMYILETPKEALVIECGKSVFDAKKALNFRINKVVGCVVSHKHQDHAKYEKMFDMIGIDVFKPYEHLEEFETVQFGGFKITAFPLEHDVPCYGFLIEHSGQRILYVSDTSYCKYRFKDIDHILVEANHNRQLLMDSESEAKEHILRGHMEIGTACRFVKANDNDRLKTVTMIHLSHNNGDSVDFMLRMMRTTKAKVYVANKERVIDL